MTTQYGYDDHRDADASVAGHPYTSETGKSEASFASAPTEEAQVTNVHTEEPAFSTPTETNAEEQPGASEVQAEAAPSPTDEVTPAQDTIAPTEEQPTAEYSEASQPPTEVPVVDEPAAIEPLLAEEAQPTASTASSDTSEDPAKAQDAAHTAHETHEAHNTHVIHETHETYETQPVVETTAEAEEVRPFTSFFEEFRQAEEARQEAQAEALSLFATAPSMDYSPLLGSNESEIADVVAIAGTVDAAEIAPLEEVLEAVIEITPGDDSPATSTTPVIADEEHQATTPQAQEPATPTPTAPSERPVSPLLRPATRLRLPRHGVIRHREEPGLSELPAASQADTTGIEQTATQGDAPAASTPTAGQEAPRPVRRYRFDNRSSANAPATPFAQTTKVENGQNGSSTPADAPVKQGSNGNGPLAQVPDEQTVKQPVTPEPQATDNTANTANAATPSSPISEQDRRRRHGQERPREKEQTATPAATTTPATTNNQSATPATPATVADVAALIEPEQPTEEVAPEDLPPLEYSELQKANPRRRRRHRSTTNSTPAAATPPTPTPAPAAPAVQPNQPTKSAPAPAEAASGQVLPPVTTSAAPRTIGNTQQYSIVSGYTVNQMNQGNEAAGPFMGPEPSPARGSVISRDGRNTRAEAQRTHVYPVRSTDPTVSSTSVHQLASVLSQAIQTQTDRMVAELRRANQGPTNVSVSLPPIPSTERVGVFVDVANLLYSARTMRIAVDFGKLLDFLRGNRRLVRAHAYCPTSPQAGDEQMFLQAVKGLGYRITTKNYKTFSSGAKKADLDLDLCMDVVRLVDGKAVDCVVLVSGDSDFMPMLDYCSDHGVRVEVAAFDEAMSATLRQSCDLFINLSMLEDIRA